MSLATKYRPKTFDEVVKKVRNEITKGEWKWSWLKYYRI